MQLPLSAIWVIVLALCDMQRGSDMAGKQALRIVTLIGSSMAWREQIMAGIAAYAHDHGPWHVYTAPEGFENTLFFTRGYQWDGVIARVSSRRLARAIATLGVPAVNLSQLRIAGVTIPRVQVDEKRLAQLAFDHLLGGGFRRFAYCSVSAILEERRRAFAAVVRAARYEFADYRRFTTLPDGARWQRRQKDLARWVRQLPKPIGILAWNADTGCQLVEACNLAGVRIPDEAAILAGDDDKMKCELCDPSVSAVEFPGKQIGYQAAALLGRMLAGSPTPRADVTVAPSGMIALRRSSDSASLSDRDVYRAVQFIRDHATEAVDVRDVVRQLNVSRRWLERHFQRVLGRSPSQEIRRVRLDLARRYLLETDWPTERIAKAAGLGSASHLNRIFRSELGLRPGEFRSRYRI